LSNLDSFLARVLKGKYFYDCSFLEAKPKTNASFSWKNIRLSRDLLKRGIRWRVGNGNNIRVASDNWIPSEPSLKLLTSEGVSSNMRVSALILGNESWDEEKLWL